jgi:Sulfotransferase family
MIGDRASENTKADLRSSPIVIGGTGGSGTRLVQSILAGAGVFMGRHLNAAGDALDFVGPLDRFINPILAHTRSLDYCPADLPAELSQAALSELSASSRRISADCPWAMQQWGWKNPRSMFVLPILHEIYPQLRFIHVLRDGRDMAFSSNQNQPQQHYAALFGGTPTALTFEDALRFWAKANCDVSSWGVSNLGDRYLVLRLEDICDQPEPQIRRLLHWLDLPDRNASALRALVATPKSMGRWRQCDDTVQAKLDEVGGEALQRFGYCRQVNGELVVGHASGQA